MSSKTKDLLLDFHVGSIDDEGRKTIERDLLLDPELLVEYLDLKRRFEAADTLAAAPSPQIFRSLIQRIPAKKKWVLSLSLGLVAASLFLFFFVMSHNSPEITSSPKTAETLFDSSAELPNSLSVL